MENFHAFPPFCLIPQILQKMENEYAEELQLYQLLQLSHNFQDC